MVRKSITNEKWWKILTIINVALLIFIAMYIFLYYTYYEWGKNEDVTWVTLSSIHAQWLP